VVLDSIQFIVGIGHSVSFSCERGGDYLNIINNYCFSVEDFQCQNIVCTVMSISRKQAQ